MCTGHIVTGSCSSRGRDSVLWCYATAWLDSSCSKDLKAVLTDVALRGRDWMDTSYVAECNGANVDNILLRMGCLIHTVVPEMFWKEYSLNKLGVLLHPISVSCGAFGSLYVVDYTLGCLLKIRLHNPADVQVLARDILNHLCHLWIGCNLCHSWRKSVIFGCRQRCEIKSQSTEEAMTTRRTPHAWPAWPRWESVA